MAKDIWQFEGAVEDQAPDRDRKPSVFARFVEKAAVALRADADMEAVLNAFQSLDPDAVEKCTVEEARRQPTAADAVNRVLTEQGRSSDPACLVPDVVAMNMEIPGAAGPMRARMYRPQAEGPLPGLLYLHGGGWGMGDLDASDASARGIASQARAIVVSIDYRRAPEAKFPAAWHDALAGWRWLALNAATMGVDPERLAIAGESAGGCLAVATAIALRDLHDDALPPPRHVVAIYPVAQTGSLATPSYIETAVAQPLSRAMVPWFLDKLLRTADDKEDTRLDLVNADLVGLPPVTIVNAQLDPLRSDGARLEEALQDAGVPVERRDFHGVTHEFFGMAAVVAKAAEAQAWVGERLRTAFTWSTPLV
jgi:acetyl esterase/lipase